MRCAFLLLAAIALQGCVGVGRSCTKFYGLGAPLVRVGVHVPCSCSDVCAIKP